MSRSTERRAGMRSLLVVALLASLCTAAAVTSAPASATSTAYVLPPRTGQQPRAVRAIDTSGDLVVIGSTGATTTTSSGTVNVYRRSGASYVFEATLRSPNPELGSGFGEAVAVDGVSVVVGAPTTDSSGADTGAAFVYRFDGTTWALQQELIPSNRPPSARFGTSVDIEGSNAIVGEIVGVGGARVFTRSGGTWSEQQLLAATGSNGTWQLGASVAISGTTAAIGAPNATVGAATSAGKVAVFTRNAGTWTEQQVLQASSPSTSDKLGYDVALDGDTVVAGGYQPSVGAGRAVVFTRSAGSWTEQQALNPVGGATIDFYGFSVALEGDVIAVGAYGDDTPGNGVGTVHTYQRSGTTWTLVAELAPAASSPGSFGFDVALEGSRLAMGALSSNVPYPGSGAFEVRDWDGTAWSASSITQPVSDEHAGTSVDVSGSVAAVGVPDGWSGSGRTGYVTITYAGPSSWTATTPTQVLRPIGAAPGDGFGTSVALQGSTLAAGAPGAAAVEVYERSGTTTTWTPVATLTVPGATPADGVGFAVALDGDRLAVGAPGDDADGLNAGAVFVSQRTGATWGPLVRASVTDPARAGDTLGASVAIAGDLVVAGAPRDDSVANNAGAVVRLTPDGGGGWHTASAADLVAPTGAAAGDNVGASVAVSATRIVVGAPDADPLGAGSGQVWLISRTSGAITSLLAPGGGLGDHFGRSVAADGAQIAVGADGDDLTDADNGSVARFGDSGSVVGLIEQHLAPDAGAGDGLGRSVAVDSDEGWLVAGAPAWDAATADLGTGYAWAIEPDLPPPGELRVTTNPAVASTILVDGIPRDQWGLTWLDLRAKTYEVCFTDVPGYVTPPCEDATVTLGQTTTVDGAFTPMATLQVTTSPPVASTITLQDLTAGTPAVARNKWGVFRRVTPDHAVRVCFGPVAGWNPPPCQDVAAADLGSGEFKQVTGTFVANASAPGPTGKGELRVTTNPALPATILVNQLPRDEWGLTWLELDPGTYQVCATDVPGYATPSCASATVVAGVATEISLTFTQLGYLRIVTDPAQEATLSVDGVPRNDWGAWFPIEAATHEVCFGPSKGSGSQPTPACQTVDGPTAGQTLTVTGTYP